MCSLSHKPPMSAMVALDMDQLFGLSDDTHYNEDGSSGCRGAGPGGGSGAITGHELEKEMVNQAPHALQMDDGICDVQRANN